MLENLPARLRQFRREYNYKLHDVAKMLELSIPTISSYERGTRMPTLPVLVQLAKLYHCTTDYLLGLDNVKPDTSDVAVKLNVLKQRLSELEDLVSAQNVADGKN